MWPFSKAKKKDINTKSQVSISKFNLLCPKCDCANIKITKEYNKDAYYHKIFYCVECNNCDFGFGYDTTLELALWQLKQIYIASRQLLRYKIKPIGEFLHELKNEQSLSPEVNSHLSKTIAYLDTLSK